MYLDNKNKCVNWLVFYKKNKKLQAARKCLVFFNIGNFHDFVAIFFILNMTSIDVIETFVNMF